MKRRGLLKALGAVLLAPVTPILTQAKVVEPVVSTLAPATIPRTWRAETFFPAENVGRGMCRSIFYYDELAFIQK